jgi:deoxyadenosine/deoxycytidine kinase
MPKNCFSSNQAYFRSCKPRYTRLLHPHTAAPLVDMDINIDDALESNTHHKNVAHFIIPHLPPPQASAKPSKRNNFLK